MTTTIAIVGHNGNVGKKVLPHLIKAQQDGKVKLVVLHRPSSAGGNIPSDVERRVTSGTDAASLKDSVKGLNVVLSTIGPEGFGLQETLLEALGGSPDIPTVRASHEPYDRLDANAKKYGISLTQIRAGLFLAYAFFGGFVGLDAKANKIELYKDALNKPFHISHLGAVIADVVLRDPSSIANKNFYTYTFSPTGQELVDLFTAFNGSPPEVTKYTDEQYEKDTDVPGMPVVGATYRRRWGDGKWGWDTIDANWVDVDKPKGSLQKLAQPFFAK